MGDRVSISFQQETEWYVKRKKEKHMDQSPALFHHWGGTTFPKFAFQWFKDVKAKYAKHGGDPFTRMEPRNLMVQFIAHLRNHEELRYYWPKTPSANDLEIVTDDQLMPSSKKITNE